MRNLRTDERGVALVVAIFALVVIGALVAGTFFVGRLEQRIGASSVYVTQAGEAADAGLVGALSVDQVTLNAMTPWTPTASNEVSLGTTYYSPGSTSLRYTTTVRRLNSELFLVRSLGERLAGNGSILASDQRGLLIRLVKATINVNSAITVMQPIQLNGNAFTVTGRNTNPPGWQDPAAGWVECPNVTNNGDGDDKVGIRSASGTGVTGQDEEEVTGYPVGAVANDPTITSATFRNFVDQTFTTLTSQPGVKLLVDTEPYDVAPKVTGGTCDKTAVTEPFNFGEPSRTSTSTTYAACYNYFPVVSGTGTRTKFAANSRGQGTLLINGDLEIAGGFEWNGLIIVRGSFKITGNGNKITGAVLAESVTGDNSIGGRVAISYSACAIQKAINGASVAASVDQRSWMQLY